MTLDPVFAISKAKTALLMDHPFFGSIAMSMKYIIDDDFFVARKLPPTAATNGQVIYLHSEFIAECTADGTVSQLVFLIAHECMHAMLGHCDRVSTRDKARFNIAADLAINEVLVTEHVGTMSPRGLRDTELYAQGHGTAEGIYPLIPSQSGSQFDSVLPSGGDSAEQASQWKLKVAQAAQAARMVGKLSTNMQRLVDLVLPPCVPWQDVLYRFVVRCRTEQRSFARFNRRFIAQDMYLPSVSGTQLGTLVVAIDCSGSIDTHTLAQFTAEIKAIKEDLLPVALHVIYFDSRVCGHDVFTVDDPLVISPRGGGGTDFTPIFTYIEEHELEPVACVVLTDLCCDSFGPPPEYPVLWVTTDDGNAPFGEIIKMQ